MGAQLTATWHCAGGQLDEWAAEGGVAPPIPPGTTPLLDDVLHVEMHAFCHKFLADGVGTLPLCFGSSITCLVYIIAPLYLPGAGLACLPRVGGRGSGGRDSECPCRGSWKPWHKNGLLP